MKKIFFSKNFIYFFVVGVISFFSANVLFKLSPKFSDFLYKMALISVNLNFSKDQDIISCFKYLKQNDLQQNYSVDLKKQLVDEEMKKNNEARNVEDVKKQQDTKQPFKIKTIVRKTCGALNSPNFINIGGSAFARNMTKLPADVILKANEKKPVFRLEKTAQPQVLIYHTHTTESYEISPKDSHDKNFSARSKDPNISVVAVGEKIADKLQQNGINVIHDRTIHDDPAFSGAYLRSKLTINDNLKKHPKIKVMLDIHRDAMVNDKDQSIAPVADVIVDGRPEKVAQIMIISGCDDGTMNYKNYQQNLSFACDIQKQLETDFKFITRPLSFKYKKYNQNIGPGVLLIEVGSQANSIDEAKKAGECLGRSLSNLLKNKYIK